MRYSRLALSQDLGELTDAEFPVGKQCQQAEASGFRSGAKPEYELGGVV